MLENLHQATLVAYIGTEFQVIDNAKPVCALKLAKILEGVKSPVQEAFSLIFYGPLEFFLPQGLRRLKHAKLGEMDIFLVPIGKKSDGYEYEAVFNHLIQPAQANR